MRATRSVIGLFTVMTLVLVATQCASGPGAEEDMFPGLAKPGVITFVDSCAVPPGSFLDDDGNPAGVAVDLVKMWGEDLGLEVEVVCIDWAGVLPGIQSGKYDVGGSGVRHTQERLDSPDYHVLRPHRGQSVGVMVRKDSGIDSYADLAGKRLGATRGEQYEPVVRETYVEELGATIGDVLEGETTEYPGLQEGILDILNGRIDALTTSASSLSYSMAASPRADELKILQPTLAPAPSGVFIRNDVPEFEKAVNCLNAIYLENGALDNLHNPYYEPPTPVDILRQLLDEGYEFEPDVDMEGYDCDQWK